jgi:hypothetical protein
MDYSIIGADDREYGPVGKHVLVEWARDGRVVPKTMVLEHSSGRRFLACDLPELAAVFGGALTVAPPLQGRSYPMAIPPASYPPVIYLAPPKSRMAAGLLGIFLGMFGAHRFYLGHTGVGFAMLVYLRSWSGCNRHLGLNRGNSLPHGSNERC